MSDLKNASLYERIYAVTEQIPAGKVATYGQIAAIVGPACTARIVGYAMAALKAQDNATPWQRVINVKGEISERGGGGAIIQRQFLEHEGVSFDDKDQIDFDEVGWEGPNWDWLDTNGFYPAPSLKGKKKKKATGNQPSLF